MTQRDVRALTTLRFNMIDSIISMLINNRSDDVVVTVHDCIVQVLSPVVSDCLTVAGDCQAGQRSSTNHQCRRRKRSWYRNETPACQHEIQSQRQPFYF